MLGPALHAAFWGLIRTAPADRDLPAIRASAVKTGEALAIVDAQTDERIVRIPLPAMPSDLRFSSDGSQLVVGLANGRLIILGSKGISDGT